MRGTDGVQKTYTHEGWIPIASASGGSIGQSIVIGPDEDLRRVIAPDIHALFQSAINSNIGSGGTDDQRHFFHLEHGD